MNFCLLIDISFVSFHNPKIKTGFLWFFFPCCAKKDSSWQSCPYSWQNSSLRFSPSFIIREIFEPRILILTFKSIIKSRSGKMNHCNCSFQQRVLVFVHLSRSLLLLVCYQRLPVPTCCSTEGKHVSWACVSHQPAFPNPALSCRLPPARCSSTCARPAEFHSHWKYYSYHPHQSGANM